MANMRKQQNVAVTDVTTQEKTETNPTTMTMEQMQAQIDMLSELVRKTGNINKIAEFDREKNKMEGFAYSLRLYPTDSGDKVITSWKSTRDFVADEGRITDQKVKLEYDGGAKEIDLVDFSRILKRTPKIVAKSLTNLDGTPVLIDSRVNEEDNFIFSIIRPKDSKYIVTLDYEGKEYTIESTYLNA